MILKPIVLAAIAARNFGVAITASGSLVLRILSDCVEQRVWPSAVDQRGSALGFPDNRFALSVDRRVLYPTLGSA